jgi:hypothetical protein
VASGFSDENTGQGFLPLLRETLGARSFERGGEIGVLLLVLVDTRTPFALRFDAAIGHRAAVGAHVVGNEKARLERPVQFFFGRARGVGAQRFSVRFLRVLLGAAVTDVCVHTDKRRPVLIGLRSQ